MEAELGGYICPTSGLNPGQYTVVLACCWHLETPM